MIKAIVFDMGGVLHPVGYHIINVFHEDNVGFAFVEVFYQGPMSARSEHQTSIFFSDGLVLLVNCYDISIVPLFG